LQQKPKAHWHSQGDRNTTYFYIVAKIRSASSLITSMTNGDDMSTNSYEINEHVVDHFFKTVKFQLTLTFSIS